jgi:Uma2 family endonuclease
LDLRGTVSRSAKYDHGAKRALYARSGVPWYWLVDPLNSAIQVLRLEGPSYVLHQVVGDSGLARLEPFDALEIELDSLLPPGEYELMARPIYLDIQR